MKLLHTADLHKDREHFAELEASLDVVEREAHARSVDLIAIAGDLYNGAEQNSERDAHDPFIARIQRLGNIAPVAIVGGTPSHDIPGSLDMLQRLACQYGITILQPGIPYFLDRFNGCITKTYVEGQDLALLFGVPEPQKKWLLANGGATGKDEGDLAVRQAMRGLLLGLGGIRKQTPDLPCILLYHGQVSGARTGTGYEAGSGIAISKDDLALVGADYIAMGDIHFPQQIPGLPAFYPGKAYAGDWKEQGYRFGCNLATVEFEPCYKEAGKDSSLFGTPQFVATVERVDFPHPERLKIERKPGDEIAYETLPLEGKLVWEDWAFTRDEAEAFDVATQLEGLRSLGALEGSKVTTRILPTETVRAGEITEKRRLHEKVVVWATNSAIELPEGVLIKADELERDAQASGAAGDGAWIRIDRLVLRGAIGISKKSKKDEIDLNLEMLGPGVFALVGPNGTGKTTIVENMHGWASLLTRDGTLKDHFRLQDSFRDLYFTDLHTGIRYRALINIRADIASGATEYFLFEDTGAGFKACPGITGRKEPYEAAITRLFGSLELFLKTAFQTQRTSKYSPDLADATQGQRKALFGELAGLDYLERYREACKTRADALEVDLRALEATIVAAADVDEALRIAREEIELQEANARNRSTDAEISLEKGRGLRSELDTLTLKVQNLWGKRQRYATISRSLAELNAEISAADSEIRKYHEAAAGQESAQTEIRRVDELASEAASLIADKTKLDEADKKLLDAFWIALREYSLKGEERNAELNRAKARLSTARQASAVARAKLLEPVADTCPTCGQILPVDRLEAIRHAHEEATEKIGALDCEEENAEAEVARLTILLEEEAKAKPTKPDPTPYPGDARLHEIERALEWLDRAAAEATLQIGREASVRIEEGERRKASALTKKLPLDREAEEIRLELEAEEGPALSAQENKKAELQEEQEKYTTARGAAEAAQARSAAARQALAAAEKRGIARDEAKGKRAAAALEREDWRLLERAVGPNGIQALELDALAPSIMSVSNALLSEAYGSRYQLEVRTTRIAGTGSQKKQVEAFEIFVLDTESGDEQEIATLSGGEAVWIRKALYDGFAIIRARNTGTKFQTVFLDEADGALDPAARMLYLRMLEAAHRASGRFQTIIITHSTELQAMVEQVIDIAALGPRKDKA